MTTNIYKTMANVKAIKEGYHSYKQQYIMVILEIVDLHKSVISLKLSIEIQVKYKSDIAMLQKYNEQKRWRNKTATQLQNVQNLSRFKKV